MIIKELLTISPASYSQLPLQKKDKKNIFINKIK